MTVSAGWTAQEIGDFVREYERQRHGTKAAWLAGQGVSAGVLRRWKSAVVLGDVARGLVPRKGMGVANPPSRRRADDARISALEAENDRLRAENGRLEAANDILGKAIGLLHQMSAQEPGETPDPSGPPGS